MPFCVTPPPSAIHFYMHFHLNHVMKKGIYAVFNAVFDMLEI